MKIKKSTGERIFDTFNILFFFTFSLVTFYPFWHEVCISFSDKVNALRGGIFLWPRGFNVEAYKLVLSSQYLITAFTNSLFITVLGVIISVMLGAGVAYLVSKKHLPGHKFLNMFIIISIIFNGGIIPTYLIVKGTGLVDSLWALIVLAACTPFNVVIMKNFFQNLPSSLEESALMDGASPLLIFFRIVLPLSKPVLATVSIWVAVSQWNDYMRGLIYLTDRSNYILPVLIRDIINGQSDVAGQEVMSESSTETVKAATIIIALVPILMVYPFLQKHFTKGIMLGAVKG